MPSRINQVISSTARVAALEQSQQRDSSTEVTDRIAWAVRLSQRITALEKHHAHSEHASYED